MRNRNPAERIANLIEAIQEMLYRMKIKKTTLIATETRESLTVRLNAQPQAPRAHVMCEECERETPMLTPEEAAPLAGLSVREINRLVEDGAIHFKETPDGLLFICLNSIGKRVTV